MSLAVALAGVLALAPGTAALADDPAVDRVLRDPAIVESSGLALSPQHAGVLWTMNDSGNPPVLYAVGPDGATRARVRLSGVPNVDWEAVAAWRDPASGTAWLAAADIGDNGAVRAGIEVDVVREPGTLTSQTIRPRRLRLTYPDGAADAETLLVDPRSNRMYVVTKGFGSRIYVVPAAVWPGGAGSGRLELVARVSGFLVTDGVVLPSGVVLLRTYSSLLVLSPLDGAEPAATLDTVGLPAQQQGEGLAVDVTARTVLLSSEGKAQPVLRIALPEAASAGLPSPSPSTSGPSPSPSSPSGPSSSASPSSASGGPQPGQSAPAAVSGSAVRWVVGAGAVLVAAGAGAVYGRRRRRP